MNQHKMQLIQSQVIQQSSSQTLDLNDMVLGYEGSRILGSLIPQYHKNLRHIRINGNNIDSQGFQMIFTGLLNCQHLKSIQAQWNSIGTSQVGLMALCSLVSSLSYLQLIDLKNNRISFHLAPFIAEIIQLNKKNLKVIDLRWNQIGELGAKQILSALAFNKNIRYIGLQDNRITQVTLHQLDSVLKSAAINNGNDAGRRTHSQPQFAAHQFPISSNDYQSMSVQLRASQLRAKIENEQKQANRYSQKMQAQIQKVLLKIKHRGAQIGEVRLKHDGHIAQNMRITSQLREAARMLALQKQRILGIQSKFSSQKSDLRNQKYRLNNDIQNIMEKYTQRNQRQLDEIQLVMSQKLDRLNAFLRQRLHQKRINRQKIVQLRQDIVKLKIAKQDIVNKLIKSPQVSSIKSSWEQKMFQIQEQIAKQKTTVQNQIKKSEYMSKQLNGNIIKTLSREQNLQKQIFDVQCRIKSIHHNMTLKNLQLQRNIAELKLKQSQIYDKQAIIQMETKYIRYLESQGNVKVQVQNMIQQQFKKGNQNSETAIQNRIAQVQKALRAQQAQNRMIKNQYQKLMSQLENISKKNIQQVLFE